MFFCVSARRDVVSLTFPHVPTRVTRYWCEILWWLFLHPEGDKRWSINYCCSTWRVIHDACLSILKWATDDKTEPRNLFQLFGHEHIWLRLVYSLPPVTVSWFLVGLCLDSHPWVILPRSISPCRRQYCQQIVSSNSQSNIQIGGSIVSF